MFKIIILGAIRIALCTLYYNSLMVSKDALDNGVSDVAVIAAVTGQLKDHEKQLSSLRTQFAKLEQEVLEQFANNNETQISLLQSRLV
jgi:hypothetical protein